MSSTRMIPAPVVRNWVRNWPCDGFPDAALQYTVDKRGNLVDYGWITKRGDGVERLPEPDGVDGRAVGALIDDAQAGDVASINPGHLTTA